MAVTKQQTGADELFDVRNSYYIGNYQQCINEIQKIKRIEPEIILESDIFLYRAYIAQKKYRIVMNEISNSSAVELQTLKFLAEYFSCAKKDGMLERFVEQFGHYGNSNYYVTLPAATFYLHENELEKAFRILHDVDELESKLMLVHLYIKIFRFDLARKELNKMQEKDEDATLTQLAQVAIYLGEGQDKLQDAYYITQEIIDKYGATPNLLNMQAACFISQKKYEESDSVLQESMEKDSNNPDTLINLIVLSGRMNKPPEVANRYLTQLKESYSSTQFVKDHISKEVEFDGLCCEYEPPSS